MSMYLRSSNSLHNILPSVLCKTNEAILTQIPCFRAALDSSGTTWYGSANHTLPGPPETRWQRPYHVVYKCNLRWTTWYGSANHSCKYVNKMAVHFSTSTVLLLCKLFEGIWNNYVDIEEKILQFRFIISLCTWGYISIGDPTWQHEVWRKTHLNTNARIHYSFWLNLVLHANFNDTKTILSWFLCLFELKSVYILIKNMSKWRVYTLKPLNNGPPEERSLVNNGQILIALAYFNTFATLKGGHPWISNNGQQKCLNNGQ